jgi:ABC-2 type transport system ATP-binding protein
MSGLDPIGRKEMRTLIQALKNDGTTVLFSSHILPDAEALCDRVGILSEGRLREIVDLAGADGSVEYSLTVCGVPPGALPELAALAVPGAAAGAPTWTVRVAGRERVRECVNRIHAAGGFVESLVPSLPSLEERFLHHAQQVDVSD